MPDKTPQVSDIKKTSIFRRPYRIKSYGVGGGNVVYHIQGLYFWTGWTDMRMGSWTTLEEAEKAIEQLRKEY